MEPAHLDAEHAEVGLGFLDGWLLLVPGSHRAGPDAEHAPRRGIRSREVPSEYHHGQPLSARRVKDWSKPKSSRGPWPPSSVLVRACSVRLVLTQGSLLDCHVSPVHGCDGVPTRLVSAMSWASSSDSSNVGGPGRSARPVAHRSDPAPSDAGLFMSPAFRFSLSKEQRSPSIPPLAGNGSRSMAGAHRDATSLTFTRWVIR